MVCPAPSLLGTAFAPTGKKTVMAFLAATATTGITPAFSVMSSAQRWRNGLVIFINQPSRAATTPHPRPLEAAVAQKDVTQPHHLYTNTIHLCEDGRRYFHWLAPGNASITSPTIAQMIRHSQRADDVMHQTCFLTSRETNYSVAPTTTTDVTTKDVTISASTATATAAAAEQQPVLLFVREDATLPYVYTASLGYLGHVVKTNDRPMVFRWQLIDHCFNT